MSSVKARILPPIRAETKCEISGGEPQLLKKQLKRENLDFSKKSRNEIYSGGKKDYEAQ